jgi:hypothetical protein
MFDGSSDAAIIKKEPIVLLTEAGESVAHRLVGDPQQSLKRPVQFQDQENRACYG